MRLGEKITLVRSESLGEGFLCYGNVFWDILGSFERGWLRVKSEKYDFIVVNFIEWRFVLYLF